DETYSTGLLIKERLIKGQTNVHYYRGNSAASKMEPPIIDEKYFTGAKYLYVTGITPALSESCKETIFAAVHTAKKFGIQVIFDPNVRFKLVDDMEEYKNTLNEIASLADFFLPGVGEAKFLSGIDEPEEIANHYVSLNEDVNVVIKLG